jgi:hypothetical protein
MSCVESLLEQLISPHLALGARLPDVFTAKGVAATDDMVRAAAKLGWRMVVTPPDTLTITADDQDHEDSGSEWDICAVRSRKATHGLTLVYVQNPSEEVCRAALSIGL